jgi:hypothetical protein
VKRSIDASKVSPVATKISGESFRTGDASHRAEAIRNGESTALIQLAIRLVI